MTRTLLGKLVLPFDAVRTLYEGSSEVRLYRNEITGVKQIGKRVSALGLEQATVFREATILQSIRHDHIVPVNDVAVVEQDGADPLLKMIEMIIPYYERGSVFDALQRGERFSIGQGVKLAREALLGLNELHETHKLLHRDVKSANVFLDERGRLRVGDLGVAIPMEDDGTGEAFPAAQMYTAPETFSLKRSDRRTDVYGIGMILFELLNGPFPYDQYTKLNVSQRLDKGRRAVRDEHLAFQPQVAPRLRQIISKAISRKPNERFLNARQMMDALDKAPFIDWRSTEDGEDRKVWDGRLSAENRRVYRVTAEKYRRSDRWKLCGLQYVTRWQRRIADQVVGALNGSETRVFFDQVLKAACNR